MKCCYVLEGTYISANPETGEVHVAKEGEAIFFRKDTWHHGFNGGTGPVRVLEFFAPPPSTGTSGAYARTRPYVDKPRYGRDDWLGRLPMEADALATDQHHARFARLRSDLAPGRRAPAIADRALLRHRASDSGRLQASAGPALGHRDPWRR